MLLRMGIVMMVFAVVVAAGVALLIALRNGPEEKAVVAKPVAEATEETAQRPAPREEPRPQEPELRPRPEPQSEPQQAALPVADEGWPMPEKDEVDLANGPRYFDPGPGAIMALTVEAIGIYDAPVLGSDSQQALDKGVVHVPETSLPWDEGEQRNVYLAAHRLGYQGTGSRLLFYNLDELERGDEIVLKARGTGETYKYRVSEVFTVGPYASWVMGQVRDRDMVTLQTCTPIPTFEKRLIVRADRI